MNPLHCNTLTEAMLAAPPDRPFITMWHDEDEVDVVTFGEFVQMARCQAADFVACGLPSTVSAATDIGAVRRDRILVEQFVKDPVEEGLFSSSSTDRSSI